MLLILAKAIPSTLADAPVTATVIPTSILAVLATLRTAWPFASLCPTPGLVAIELTPVPCLIFRVYLVT